MSDAIARGGNSDFHADAENPPDDLRTRIARVAESHGLGWIDNGKPDITHCYCGYRPRRLGESWHYHLADAVIRELYGILVDWGLWLAEEITGRQMTRLDMESCLTDWKADDE